MKLFISPHNDDETLFGAFTIQRERPQVVIVFDSYVQVERGYFACDYRTRRDESIQACKALGVDPPIFLGFDDSQDVTPYLEASIGITLKRKFKDAEAVWCPAEEWRGHDHHNVVSRACRATFENKVVDQYLTYTRKEDDHPGDKSISNKPVLVKPEWVLPKLQALMCYKTQIEIPQLGCWPHFIRSQEEYYL